MARSTEREEGTEWESFLATDGADCRGFLVCGWRIDTRIRARMNCVLWTGLTGFCRILATWFAGQLAILLNPVNPVRKSGMAWKSAQSAENKKLRMLSADFADYRRLRSACNIAHETRESRERML